MSLILDALDKSERDRPGAERVAVPPVQREPSRRVGRWNWRRWPWPALAVGFALLALLSRLPESKNPVPTASVAPAPAAPESPRTPETPRAAETAPEIVEPAPVAEGRVPDADVAALYAGLSADRSRPVPSAPSAAPSAAERELDVDEIARAARRALDRLPDESEPVAEHAAPFIVDLRQTVKDEIPTIYYSSHRWGSNPAEREVVLNGEARREGDTVMAGLTLLEILEDSIVLDYRGTEFRLRSLNSWINL